MHFTLVYVYKQTCLSPGDIVTSDHFLCVMLIFPISIINLYYLQPEISNKCTFKTR